MSKKKPEKKPGRLKLILGKIDKIQKNVQKKVKKTKEKIKQRFADKKEKQKKPPIFNIPTTTQPILEPTTTDISNIEPQLEPTTTETTNIEPQLEQTTIDISKIEPKLEQTTTDIESKNEPNKDVEEQKDMELHDIQQDKPTDSDTSLNLDKLTPEPRNQPHIDENTVIQQDEPLKRESSAKKSTTPPSADKSKIEEKVDIEHENIEPYIDALQYQKLQNIIDKEIQNIDEAQNVDTEHQNIEPIQTDIKKDKSPNIQPQLVLESPPNIQPQLEPIIPSQNIDENKSDKEPHINLSQQTTQQISPEHPQNDTTTERITQTISSENDTTTTQITTIHITSQILNFILFILSFFIILLSGLYLSLIYKQPCTAKKLYLVNTGLMFLMFIFDIIYVFYLWYTTESGITNNISFWLSIINALIVIMLASIYTFIYYQKLPRNKQSLLKLRQTIHFINIVTILLITPLLFYYLYQIFHMFQTNDN